MYIKRWRLKEGMGRVLNKGRLLLEGGGESNKYKLKIMGGGRLFKRGNL